MLLSHSSLLVLAVCAAGAHQSQKLLPDCPNRPKSTSGVPRIDGSFDYVVVGGGTAGITVAARLALKDFHVALVEAGDYYELKSVTASVPGADSLDTGSSPTVHPIIDWGFVARNVSGANYRDIHYARGKCLGGSYARLLVYYGDSTDHCWYRSVLNFMVYQRFVLRPHSFMILIE